MDEKAGPELVITRIFDAPPSLVFQAWSAPEHAGHWWGPKGFTLTSCTMDFRPGGKWRYCMRSPEGVDYWSQGVYREIAPPDRLVFTFAWDDEHDQPSIETLVTLTFADVDGKTRFTFHQAPFESTASRDSHSEGWSESFDRLAAYTSAASIRKMLDAWTNAIRAKDSHGLVTNFAPKALLFDLIDPLQYVGADQVEKRAEEWLSSFEGPIDYEVRDLKVAAGDVAAFCHSLNRVKGTKRDGQKIEMWWRSTVCFEKLEGKWTVTHEHSSVPFNMQTGRASLDLKP